MYDISSYSAYQVQLILYGLFKIFQRRVKRSDARFSDTVSHKIYMYILSFTYAHNYKLLICNDKLQLLKNVLLNIIKNFLIKKS